MANGDCIIGVEVKTEVRGIKDRMETLHEEDELQWTAIEKIRELLNRPPAWCCWAMTALGTALGGALGALITVLVS